MRAEIAPSLDALTEKIIGSAFAVSRTLGHGVLKMVYRQSSRRSEAGYLMTSVPIRGRPCPSVLLNHPSASKVRRVKAQA
ncbi:MAG TPA: hypothetical protein VN809_05560 [Telmatospirillum sp.]|nr:hypothetical protein [Telmatospirillum sp.]